MGGSLQPYGGGYLRRCGVLAWPRKLVDGLFFWQREHCKSSYESEREGRQSPPELRRVTPEA